MPSNHRRQGRSRPSSHLKVAPVAADDRETLTLPPEDAPVMSSERVMVQLTPDEYVQLRDEAAERSTADAPRDIAASLSANEDHQVEDADDDEVAPFAAAAGLANLAKLGSAMAASPDQTPLEHDPDPHFDKLATRTAVSQRPSGPPGTALIDAPPARRSRRRVSQQPARTGEREAARRPRRRWTILAAAAIPVVAVVLVLDRPQPSATNSAPATAAGQTSGLGTLGALLAPLTHHLAVLGEHATSTIEGQETGRRRSAGEHAHTQASRRAHARHPPAQASKSASAQAVKESSTLTVTSSANTETQPAPSESVAPTTAPQAGTYTHQPAGPTSLGSQVGSGCDPTCR